MNLFQKKTVIEALGFFHQSLHDGSNGLYFKMHRNAEGIVDLVQKWDETTPDSLFLSYVGGKWIPFPIEWSSLLKEVS